MLFKRNPKKGDIVVRIRADGCMATDWRVLWFGKIVSFFKSGPDEIKMCNCEVLRYPGGGLGTEKAVFNDLREVSKGLWIELV